MPMETLLYSCLSPRQLLNRSPITENWLYSSISPLNWLYGKIRKNHNMFHTNTAQFFARKCDVTACANDFTDDAVKIKDGTTLCR